jgi:copper chaperone CopZ
MLKTTLEIDGMMCGMCESHMNDLIRQKFNVKKVSSSHSKGITEIISEESLDEDKLREEIAGIGYTLKSVNTEEYVKKGFLLFGRKK